MAQLREDKKREILEFLEENAEEGNVLPLELENIKENLADEVFEKDSIEEIIDELEDEGLVIKKTAKMDVVYPKGYQESIEERFSHLFIASDTVGYYVVGSFAYLLLLEWQPFFDFVYESNLEPQEMIFRYSLFGIIGVYLIGKIAVDGYNKAQENVKALRKYRYLIYPTFIIAAISGSILLFFSSSTDQPITTTHVAGIITVSVGAGVTIGRILIEKKEHFD